MIILNSNNQAQYLLKREDIFNYLSEKKGAYHACKFLSTLSDRKGQLLSTIIEHIQISFIALLIATIIAVPLGILLTKLKTIRNRDEYCCGAPNYTFISIIRIDDTYIWDWTYLQSSR